MSAPAAPSGGWHRSRPDSDGLVHVAFMPPWPEGESVADYAKALVAGDEAGIARLRPFFTQPGFDRGYVAGTEDAEAIIASIEADVDPVAPDLVAADFEPAGGGGIADGSTWRAWRKRARTGWYRIAVRRRPEGRIESLHLSFEAGTRGRWQNLLRLEAPGGIDGNGLEVSWPEPLQGRFEAVATRAALAMAGRWRDSGRERLVGRIAWNRLNGVGPGRA